MSGATGCPFLGVGGGGVEGLFGVFWVLFFQPQERCADIKGRWCPLLVTPRII